MIESAESSKKNLFKVNDVCAITGIKSYVLRFWETEFEEITPLIASNGQRLYEQKDIDIINKIKKLLFDEKLTVDKAKVELKKRDEYVSAPIIQATSTPNAANEKSENKKVIKKNKIEMSHQKVEEMISIIEEIKKKHGWFSPT